MNNFWCKPNITSLRVGDMASGPNHGGLRSSSSFCSWSPALTNPLGDLRPIFNNFKMARHVENDSLTMTLSRGSLVENWIYFSLNLNKTQRAEPISLSVLLNQKWQMRIEFLSRRRPARSSWGRRSRNKMFWQLSWGPWAGAQFPVPNIEQRSVLHFD